MAIDKETLQFEKLFCRFPCFYDSKIIPNFKQCHITTDGEFLYVGFEADSNIYVYDASFNIIGKFGVEESNINTNYPETKTLEEAEELYSSHKKNYDFYGEIYSYGKYLFREVYADNNKKIQVYRNYTYINTIDALDRDYKIFGYNEPYFYAIVDCNYDTEEYIIIAFTINEKDEVSM